MNLIDALQNYILYLTPLYLLFMRVWSDRLKLRKYFDRMFNILIISPFIAITLILFILFPIWLNPIHLTFYIVSFWLLYITISVKHHNPIGSFSILVYTLLGIFAISEIWEIPIIYTSILSHNLIYNIQHIFLASLKLVSIPIMLLFIRKDFKHTGFKPYMNLVYFSILGFFMIFFFRSELTGLITKFLLLLSFISMFWMLESKHLNTN
jgi:hypothetical protein